MSLQVVDDESSLALVLTAPALEHWMVAGIAFTLGILCT